MQEHRPFLPYGFQFRPTDEEIIVHYLSKKVSGTLLPVVQNFIIDCDLYDTLPSEIWKSHGGLFLNVDEDLYFFTHLKKRSSNGSRFNRKVGSSGSWQGEAAAKDIVTGKSKLKIGSMKRFRYENKGFKDHGAWIMHEYTLNPTLLPPNQATNYVLCRLRKNQQTGKQQKLDLRKKRKLLDVQNNQYEKESEKLLTQQLTSVECQSEVEGSVATMAQEGPSCSTDNDNQFEEEIERLLKNVESAQSLVTMAQEAASCITANDMMSEEVVSAEIGGVGYTLNFDEQYGGQDNMILSNHSNGSETTSGIDYSPNIYTVAEPDGVQRSVPDETLQTWSMLQQQECSNTDPLNGLTDEDFCLLGKILYGTESEDAMVTVVEQEARCNTGLKKSDQSLSGSNGLQTGGMEYSTSVAEQQHEATMVIMRDFQQILSDNPIALENGNVDRQETREIAYDLPMEMGDEILQSKEKDMVQYEDWSYSDLMVDFTDKGFLNFC